MRNRRARPDEQLPDGSFKLADERPWKQAPGAPRRVYGEDGERDEAADDGALGGAASLGRLLFPFAQVGPRGSPARALVDDFNDFRKYRDFATP